MSKQALLGKVINFGKDDLIQSIGQGGNDSVIDYRGISNYIKAKRTEYTWTQTDANNGYAVVPVVWDVPFPDANYTTVFGVNDLSNTPSTNGAWVGDFHSFTADGLNAIVYEYSTDAAIPVGNVFEVHAIAIHD